MTGLPGELRELIEAGPMAHLSTISADGRNMDRDPRVVLSFDAPRDRSAFLNPYAVLKARATIQPSEGAGDLLNRLAKVYISPDTEFPAPKGPGYIVRYAVERIGGVGPWAAGSH